ncbi:hypothetical protein Tco_1405444 [Tanacetum coccineum]
MDDEPMWVADRVVAPTLGSTITIPETAKEFAIKGNHLTLVKANQFDGRTKTDPPKQIHEFLEICDMFKYRDTENEAVRLMMFPLSLTGEAKTWLDELNEETIETEITQKVLNAAAGGIFLYKTTNQAYQLLEDKVLLKIDWAKNQKTNSSLKKTVAFADEGSSNFDTDKIMALMDVMTLKMDAQIDYTTHLRIAIISKHLYSTNFKSEGKSSPFHRRNLLEEEIFVEFDEFIAMTDDENSDSESDNEEPPLKKITINTDYKIKTFLEEPPTDLELKPLHDNLEYVFLEEPSFLPAIISSQLSKEKKQTCIRS